MYAWIWFSADSRMPKAKRIKENGMYSLKVSSESQRVPANSHIHKSVTFIGM